MMTLFSLRPVRNTCKNANSQMGLVSCSHRLQRDSYRIDLFSVTGCFYVVKEDICFSRRFSGTIPTSGGEFFRREKNESHQEGRIGVRVRVNGGIDRMERPWMDGRSGGHGYRGGPRRMVPADGFSVLHRDIRADIGIALAQFSGQHGGCFADDL